jgi:hypothetical protein
MLRDMLAQSLGRNTVCPICGRNFVYICDCNNCLRDSNNAPHQVECTGCLASKLLKPSNVPVHS